MTGKSESSLEFKAQEVKSVSFYSQIENEIPIIINWVTPFMPTGTPILKTSKCDNQIHNAFQFYIQVEQI